MLPFLNFLWPEKSPVGQWQTWAPDLTWTSVQATARGTETPGFALCP